MLSVLKYDRVFMEWIRCGNSNNNINTNINGNISMNGNMNMSDNNNNKNYKRYLIVMITSLILNRKIFHILFSGFYRIPITCCQISNTSINILIKRIKILCIIGICTVEIPVIGYVIYTLIL